MTNVDPIEIAVTIASLAGTLFTVWATFRSFVIWRNTISDPRREDLRGISLRRLWLSAFTCMQQIVIFVLTVVTLFLASSPEQTNVRGATIIIVSLLMLFRALYEYWENRSVDKWSGVERRKSHLLIPADEARVRADEARIVADTARDAADDARNIADVNRQKHDARDK